jgi:signal transduction histidine kinase
VFEPFFTTKGVGRGTGLGLDVSWRVITNRHGGDLQVHSEPGDTRFQVRLPLHTPEMPDATEETAVAHDG